MPLWQMFVPEGAYTAEDKKALSERITDIYSTIGEIPRFYTTVFFHEAKPESFLVGGEPRDQFVQVAIVHAARTADEVAEKMGITVPEIEKMFLMAAHEALKPYVAERGYEWELHVEAVSRETWNIDGMAPPPQWSAVEKRWARDNKSSPYTEADL
jgi:phenylpyruvate tautomerase PptA (4-oxalocrotonate tautomerase family)